jgi:hypothetical protein
VDVKEKVKIVVQQVVEAYLKEQTKTGKNKSIAILLAYQSIHPQVIMEAITTIVENYEVTLLITKDWLKTSGQLKTKSLILTEETQMGDLESIIENTSLLVIPAASYQLISKLALTIDDDLAVWLAIQFQLQGKPIIIANNHIEPSVYQQIHAPYTVLERLNSYIRQIRTDQVKWVSLNKLQQSIEHELIAYGEKKALILEKHIEQASREGISTIEVPRNSQVTPAAKDLARDLKIKILDSPKGG